MVEDLFEIDKQGRVLLAVHAQPGAGRSAVVGRHGDALKVRVAAPPEQGRANEALTGLLAEELGVKENQVELVSGPSSRSKRFRITGLEEDDVKRALHRLLDPRSGPGRGGSRRPDMR